FNVSTQTAWFSSIRHLNTHIPRQSKSAVFWSRLYFACSAGGATMDVLHKYAQNQKTPE
ncbi:hypothetical protein E1297_01625, partial [Roseibium sp. RKSG952]|nr:hypothetical protein [Roseibium sp. RKSG952]